MLRDFDVNKKYLIVNADDFGLTEGINLGIIEGFQKGIITSASVMVAADAFTDAIQRTKENPGLAVGVHLTLVAGKPVLAPDRISTLVDVGGSFYSGYPSLFYRLLLGKIRITEVEQELQAQVERFLDTGLNISHVDGHLHVHLYPTLFPIVIRLAQKYKIPYIRCSQEMLIQGQKVNFSRRIKATSLNWVAQLARKKIREANLKTSTYFYGMSHSGHLTEEIWLALLPQVQAGVTEVMCHPGYEDEELYHQIIDPTYQRKEELKGLTSPRVKEMMHQFGIELINSLKLEALWNCSNDWGRFLA